MTSFRILRVPGARNLSRIVSGSLALAYRCHTLAEIVYSRQSRASSLLIVQLTFVLFLVRVRAIDGCMFRSNCRKIGYWKFDIFIGFFNRFVLVNCRDLFVLQSFS